jgi:hypothetical protein
LNQSYFDGADGHQYATHMDSPDCENSDDDDDDPDPDGNGTGTKRNKNNDLVVAKGNNLIMKTIDAGENNRVAVTDTNPVVLFHI